jgi:hypothetical protein
VTPVCFAVLASVLVYPWPLHASFALSRAAFEQAARQYLTGPNTPTGPRWIGLYRVMETRSDEPGTVSFMTGESLVDAVGFVYDPRNLPTAQYWYQVAPGWYMNEW